MTYRLGEPITGTVQGVPVSGYWTGTGIRVEQVDDGLPLDYGPYEGRWVLKQFISIGGTYMLDRA